MNHGDPAHMTHPISRAEVSRSRPTNPESNPAPSPAATLAPRRPGGLSIGGRVRLDFLEGPRAQDEDAFHALTNVIVPVYFGRSQ